MPPCHRRRLLGTLAIAALTADSVAAYAQTPSTRPSLKATRTVVPPLIDGRLVDECWSAAETVTDFTQRDPDEGMPASERTEVRILYDNDALYIGARLFDSDPGAIARRLTPRDGDREADRLTIYLDSMHDHLTGAAFGVGASNVQEDTILSNDTFSDSSWDAVWQSEVSIDDEGWSVEMRIPLSQLRFPAVDRQTWGINIERFIRRKNENAWLEMVPKNETGMTSRMRDLTALDGLAPPPHLELVPYTAARSEFIAPKAPDDPFNDGSRAFGAVGLDAKWGVTSNLTLDASVNPDFGQVEVDPAVVNLTDFETFFPEKRGFFLEGAQIFDNFGQGGSNSFWGFNASDPKIFYSRRIGRAPQVGVRGDFVDRPSGTTILGATKLTGKTSGGWSVGLLEAVTDAESARMKTGALVGSTVVEPLTNYAVGRAQHELGRRGGVGFIATAVNRRLDTALLQNSLTQQAYVVGTDAYVFFDRNRDWVLTGKISRSLVRGTTAALTNLQRTAQHYFQRPDAPQVRFDPARTSLDGWAGRVNFNRNSGTVLVNAALWGVSPGFESNDLGFHFAGDRAGAHTMVMWRGNDPNRFSRSRSIWAAKAWTWNFNRELQYDAWITQAAITFANYWSVFGGGNVRSRVFDDQRTRGGPSTIGPGGTDWILRLRTDARQWFSVEADLEGSNNDVGGSSDNARLMFSLKPSSSVTFSTGPEWNRSRTIGQYVAARVDPTAVSMLGGRYIFATLDQKQLSMTTRLSVILTSKVSLQMYMQPLLAVGDFTHFKEFTAPRTFDFLEYGIGDRLLAFDPTANRYTLDPDSSGPAPPISFGNPDFNFKSLRLNTLFRWEVKPGTNFYAVWTRQQEDTSNAGTFSAGRDARALLSAPGDDVFLVKLAYWIGR